MNHSLNDCVLVLEVDLFDKGSGDAATGDDRQRLEITTAPRGANLRFSNG